MRLSQPTETVRVPVSSRPIVCGVVGGSQRSATSCRVIFLARRTSRMRVIMVCLQNPRGYLTFLHPSRNGKVFLQAIRGDWNVAKVNGIKRKENRLLTERPLPEDGQERRGGRGRATAGGAGAGHLAQTPPRPLRRRR